MGRKKREYGYDDWKKAMELLEKGYGLTETCRILGWPETKVSTLYFWKRGRIPPIARWKAEPSNELAYVIGSLEDGCVTIDESRGQYMIVVEVIDEEFGITFSKNMSRLLNTNYHKPRWRKKRKVWRVRYYSKPFVVWYKRAEEKGLEGFKPYIEYSKETVKYYLRGLYDSEGNNNGKNGYVYTTLTKNY